MTIISTDPGPAVPAPRPAPAPADGTWAAGYEMGRLDAQLAARPVRATVGLTIRAVNRDAAAVLARKHGYDLTVRPVAEDGAVWAELRPRG